METAAEHGPGMNGQGIIEEGPTDTPVTSTPPPNENSESNNPINHDVFLAPAPSRPATPSTAPQSATTPIPPPPSNQDAQPSGGERVLNVSDALSYLDAVKIQFHDKPEVYNIFLDIMKEFKSQHIDTPGVIARVSELFHGHPALIQGFNTFLPAGYRINVGLEDFITVTMPDGQIMHQAPTNGHHPSTAPSAHPPLSSEEMPPPSLPLTSADIEMGSPSLPPAPAPYIGSSSGSGTGSARVAIGMGVGVGMEHGIPHSEVEKQGLGPAMDYVQRIKTRFSHDPDTYKQFLEILSNHKSNSNDFRDQTEVYREIERLFKDAPDLAAAFREFMPLTTGGAPGGSGIQDGDGGEDGGLQGMLVERERERHSRTRNGTPAEHGPGSHGPGGRAGSKRKQPESVAGTSVPAKRRRKTAADKEKEREKEREKELAKAKAKKSKEKASVAADTASFSQYAPSPRQASRGHGPSHVHTHLHPQSQSQSQFLPPSTPPHSHTMYAPDMPLSALSGSPAIYLSAPDESQFFDRVKRALNSRETYNEFLKTINLFTQGFIDRARLAKSVRSFIGESGELWGQFREIVGWDEGAERREMEREVGAMEAAMGGGGLGGGGRMFMVGLDRPSKEELNVRYGSYRRLPADEINQQCSGRDEMCRTVLNDEWVSHPTFASEDSGFFTQKKNIYEEALHRSEEERHEYDFHLDAIARTIGVLDPLDRKSAQMSPEERAAWKLKPNFGGSGKAIHQRIIKKIYGREAGLEVIDAIQQSPGSAIPIVVPRLKQKEEEWKRAQREWNKVWREVDAHNYYKALDHQSITFKAADKKALTSKAFVSQIEAVMEEQMAKRAMLVDPLFARARPRHQLEFELADEGVLMDCLKLTSSFVARMGTGGSGGSGSGSSAGQMRMDAERKKSVELRLLNVVKTFFMLSDEWVKSGSGTSGQSVFQRGAEHKEIAQDKTTEGEAGDGSDTSGSNPASSGSRVLSGKPADLRKNLLKNEQAKRSRGQAGQGQSPSTSRLPSPTLLGASVERELPQLLRPLGEDDSSQAMQLSDLPTLPSGGEERRPNRRRSFFTNTWFYTLLRLIEVLYSRLHTFKTLSAELCDFQTSKEAANTLGLATPPPGSDQVTPTQYYVLFLETCEKLFDNQLDVPAFEDQMRGTFGLQSYKAFTLDKVIAALVKQVQGWEQDPKLDKVSKLLLDERQIENPTAEDRKVFRRKAEEIIGPEENLFSVDWHPESKMMTFQLLSKDGSSLDDAEVLTGRWQSYVASFVSETATKDLPVSKLRRPFLRRNLPVKPKTPDLVARGALEIKVCVRTYRLFFVSNTEDVLWRRSEPGEYDKGRKRLEARNKVRRQWLKKMDEEGTGEPVSASG